MFRILIVDDETLQRDGIAEMLRLRNPDDLITEARDGLEALSIIRAIKPGIVLTDIRMPNLSGLDLLKNIKQEAPETQVIVISGYNEFEYAKKALQYNASDYLLKPIDEKELAEVIKNAKNKLTGNRLFRERYESIQKQIEGLKEQNEKHQVNLLLEKQPNACTLTLSNGFNLVQEGRVLLFQLYHEKEHSEDLLTFLSALLSECFQTNSSFALFSETHWPIIVLLLGENVYQKGFHTFLSKLHQKFLDLKVDVGVKVDNLLLKASWSFESCLSLLPYHFYPQQYDCYSADIFRMTESFSEPNFTTYEKTLTNCLFKEELMQAKKTCDAMIATATKSSYVLPILLKQQMVYLLFDSVKSLKQIITLSETQYLFSLINNLFQVSSLAAFSTMIDDVLEKIVDTLAEKKEALNTSLIELCGEYVTNHFSEDISLEGLADRFGYNTSYLSTLFKNYYQKNFTEFLTQLRMEKAKYLLLETDTKIKQVSDDVGIHDVSYFGRVFKNYWGMTPDELRKMTMIKEKDE